MLVAFFEFKSKNCSVMNQVYYDTLLSLLTSCDVNLHWCAIPSTVTGHYSNTVFLIIDRGSWMKVLVVVNVDSTSTESDGEMSMMKWSASSTWLHSILVLSVSVL